MKMTAAMLEITSISILTAGAVAAAVPILLGGPIFIELENREQ